MHSPVTRPLPGTYEDPVHPVQFTATDPTPQVSVDPGARSPGRQPACSIRPQAASKQVTENVAPFGLARHIPRGIHKRAGRGPEQP